MIFPFLAGSRIVNFWENVTSICDRVLIQFINIVDDYDDDYDWTCMYWTAFLWSFWHQWHVQWISQNRSFFASNWDFFASDMEAEYGSLLGKN